MGHDNTSDIPKPMEKSIREIDSKCQVKTAMLHKSTSQDIEKRQKLSDKTKEQ